MWTGKSSCLLLKPFVFTPAGWARLLTFDELVCAVKFSRSTSQKTIQLPLQLSLHWRCQNGSEGMFWFLTYPVCCQAPENRLDFYRRCAIAGVMLFYLTDKHVWWMNVALYRPICANFPIFPSSYCSVSVLKNSRALETRTDWLLIYCWRTRSRFLVHGFLRFYQQICEPIENPCLLLVRYSYLPTN